MSDAEAASGDAPGAAARAEITGEDKTVEFEGLTLTLPAKLPFNLLRDIRAARNDGSVAVSILEQLLGEEQLEQVWALNLDMDQGLALLSDITSQYGTPLGKSSASPSS